MKVLIFDGIRNRMEDADISPEDIIPSYEDLKDRKDKHCLGRCKHSSRWVYSIDILNPSVNLTKDWPFRIWSAECITSIQVLREMKGLSLDVKECVTLL